MELSKIISVSGKPGLYKIRSQSKGGLIVQSLLDQKKMSIKNTQDVSVLNDIAIYTYDEEKPLREIFLIIHDKEAGKKTLSHKESSKTLRSYFSEIVPNYDQEQVYDSNIKKVIQWYNLLVSSEFDFKTIEESDTKEKPSKKPIKNPA